MSVNLNRVTVGAARARHPRFTPGTRRWLPLMLVPICIGLSLVHFATVQGLSLGFSEWNLISPPMWVGIDNFAAIAADHRFWIALRNTFLLVVLTVPAKVLLGLGLALALRRITRLSDFFRLALFFPFSCSVVAVAFIWTYIYDADGLLNRLRQFLGADSLDWMAPERAMWSISAMIVWSGVGYVALLLLAGLLSIPQEYYDSARIDGASGFQTFVHLTLPLLSPSLFFVVVTGLIAAFQTFGEVYVLKGPLDSTLTIVAYIYERAFTGFQMGYAAALSAILILIILAITVVQLRVQRWWVTYDT